MGTTLTGLTPATTYDALIKTGDNAPIDATLKTLSDGLGNNLPIEVSTTGVNFTNNLTQGGTALQPVLVSGTNIKTINSTSVLGSGNLAVQDVLVSGTNIKTVNSTSILGSGNVSVQETLVSGTNIKTINSTSLLGSGDIAISANPSGVAGAIQFSNGSAFASDATKFFWDNTNKRLGVGTTTPTQSIETPNAIVFASANNDSKTTLKAFDGSTGNIDFGNEFVISRQGTIVYKMFFNNSTAIYGGGSPALRVSATQQVGIGTQGPTARLTVQGSGSTSATTSLLVQNSAGSNALQVRDDRVIIMAGLPTSSSGLPSGALWNNLGILSVA
jgi:hypothetical protein